MKQGRILHRDFTFKLITKSCYKTVSDFNFSKHEYLCTLESNSHLGLMASVNTVTFLMSTKIEVNNYINTSQFCASPSNQNCVQLGLK